MNRTPRSRSRGQGKKVAGGLRRSRKSARKMSEEAMKQTVNDPKAINQSDRAAEVAMNALPASASIEDRDRVAQEAANEAMRAANQTRLEGTKEYQKQVEKLDQINSKLRQEDQLQAEAAAKISNKKVELEGALQRENAMSDSLHGELIKLDQKVRSCAVRPPSRRRSLAKQKKPRRLQRSIITL